MFHLLVKITFFNFVLELTQISQNDLMYKATWTFEESAVYTRYSSISEKGTSLRRKSNAKSLNVQNAV